MPTYRSAQFNSNLYMPGGSYFIGAPVFTKAATEYVANGAVYSCGFIPIRKEGLPHGFAWVPYQNQGTLEFCLPVAESYQMVSAALSFWDEGGTLATPF